MIFDWIPAERLPFIFLWLEWILYAYWPSLLVCQTIAILHAQFSAVTFSFPQLCLVVFIGFCLWVVICTIRQGYAVG